MKSQRWLFLPIHIISFIIFACCPFQLGALGVNWGIQASHPLPPSIVVQLLKVNGIPKVKLFDSNSSVLNALVNSNLEVMVGIPNDMLQRMSDAAQAVAWVQNNIVPYVSTNKINIKYVAVGNEPFLTSYNGSFLNTTYPALVNVQNALNSAGLGSTVKATVPMNADVIQSTGSPSGSVFRPDISALMNQIVAWLSQNGAPYTINIYPFISLHDDPHFPVDYAFFDGSSSPVVDGAYTYQNVFDASYDSLIASLTAAGPYGNMDIIVGEIGWPTDGDVNANVDYAKKFNQGFLNHILSNVGTPRRPNTAIEFYLFSLIDEDMKSIQPGNFEPHWGMFEYDGKSKYSLSLTGGNGQTLVQASGVQYLTRQWCIYNPDSGDQSKLGDSITYACENSDCTSLGYGCSCNPYLDAAGNASYAFNQYFQRKDQGLDTCNFNGLGQVVTKDPSKGTCEFIIQLQESSNSGFISDAVSRVHKFKISSKGKHCKVKLLIEALANLLHIEEQYICYILHVCQVIFGDDAYWPTFLQVKLLQFGTRTKGHIRAAWQHFYLCFVYKGSSKLVTSEANVVQSYFVSNQGI